MLKRRAIWRFRLIFLLLAAVIVAGWAFADDPNQAGLVIQLGDGRIETRCVALEKDEITGADLLTRSGLDVVMDAASSMGVTICQIAGEGCAFPADPCFCQCMGGGECAYWNYFHRDPDQADWAYSVLGAAMRRVKAGSVDAWVWGDGRTPPADDLTFEAICRPSAPTPTVQPSPSTTPSRNARDGTRASESPTHLPATATATPAETQPAAQTPTRVPTITVPSPTSTPSSTANTAQTLSGYWPFGLMLLGLGFIGALIWLRRT